jgi:hypothetical protein
MSNLKIGITLFVFGILILSGFVVGESLQGSGEARVSFSGGVGCYSSSTLSYWIIGSNETVFNSTGNVGNCSRYYNPSIVGSTGCCPTNYFCSLSSGQCSRTTQTGCAQYNTSDDCRNDVNRVADASFESLYPSLGDICRSQTSYQSAMGNSCINFSICSCYWNSTLSRCGPSINYSSLCQGGSSSSKVCNWLESSTENLCGSQGKIVVTYNASGDVGSLMPNGVNCSNIQTDYPCSASVQLPFFDKFSFILSLLAIVGVYFIVSRKSN